MFLEGVLASIAGVCLFCVVYMGSELMLRKLEMKADPRSKTIILRDI